MRDRSRSQSRTRTWPNSDWAGLGQEPDPDRAGPGWERNDIDNVDSLLFIDFPGSGSDVRQLVITPLTKLGELEKFAHYVCTHITSKRIELESPGWSGFVINSKPDQT